MPNIICQSCQFENDPSRVFCQNCGIRLERPAGMAFQGPGSAAGGGQPASGTPARPAPVSSTHAARGQRSPTRSRTARRQPADSGSRVSILGILFMFLRWIFYGGVVAAVILMLMKPSDLNAPATLSTVPATTAANAGEAATQSEAPATTSDPVPAPETQRATPTVEQSTAFVTVGTKAWLDIRKAQESPYPRQVTLNGKQANAFVSENLRLRPSDTAKKIGWDFVGAAFTPGNGVFTLSLVQSIGGQAVYINAEFEPVAESGATNVQIRRGSIGELPIPGFLSPLLERLFQPAATSMHGKLEVLRTANNVTVDPESISLNFPGGGR